MRDTATGHLRDTLALTVRLGDHSYNGNTDSLAAAGDQRTFFIWYDVLRPGPHSQAGTRVYRFRLTRSGHITAFAPVASIPSALGDISAIAAPDGTKVALAAGPWASPRTMGSRAAKPPSTSLSRGHGRALGPSAHRAAPKVPHGRSFSDAAHFPLAVLPPAGCKPGFAVVRQQGRDSSCGDTAGRSTRARRPTDRRAAVIDPDTLTLAPRCRAERATARGGRT